MSNREKPDAKDKKRGFYLYRNNIGQVCVLIVHNESSTEHLNLHTLINETAQSNLTSVLSKLKWPTETNLVPVELDKQLVEFITSNCKHTQLRCDLIGIIWIVF